MKKLLSGLLVLLIVLGVSFSLNHSVKAETLDELVDRYWHNEDLDEGLAILHEIAESYSAEMADRRFWNIFGLPIGDALPEGLIPDNWDEYPYTKQNGFPEEAKGHPCIVIQGGNLNATLLLGFPAEMVASSIEEAEYAVIITSKWVKSGYTYIPAATSYHQDYAAYLLNLRTGEAVRFWYQRQYAAKKGRKDQLDGKGLSQEDIWNCIKIGLIDELRVEQADGSVLLFRVHEDCCYLKEYAGEPKEIVIPEEVSGYPVTALDHGCLQNCATLVSVILPEGLERIGGYAFYQCTQLENVTFPSGLKEIGEFAFAHTSLTEAVLPEGLSMIGDHVFYGCVKLVSVALPGSLQSIGNIALYGCTRLSRIILGDGLDLPLGEIVPDGSENLAMIYLPASMAEPAVETAIGPHTAVYAPEDSRMLKWAIANGNRTVVCTDPAEMPEAAYITEGDFDFRILEGEAAVADYHGSTHDVEVPASVDGYPVRILLTRSFDMIDDSLNTLRLPSSIRLIQSSAVTLMGFLYRYKNPTVYIPGKETVLEADSIILTDVSTPTLAICAPKGSYAEQYVKEKSKGNMCYFEAWEEESEAAYGFTLEANTGYKPEIYPYVVPLKSSVWYIDQDDIDLIGLDAICSGLDELVADMELDFADVRVALADCLPSIVPPVMICTDFSGTAEISKSTPAYYNPRSNFIKVFHDWRAAKASLLHEYVHYLTFACAEVGIREGFWAEGVADYVARILCQNRMSRSVNMGLSEEEISFFREKGAWDPKDECIDEKILYYGIAELNRMGLTVGQQYYAVSNTTIERTEKIQQDPKPEQLSYYEAACMTAYLADAFGEDFIYQYWGSDPNSMQNYCGLTFHDLYDQWAEWNTRECERLGIEIK